MSANVASYPITVGVGAFLVRRDALLVVRKTYGPWAGRWAIPSGYVEPRESVVRTVEREVLEETGIIGRAGRLIAVRNLVTPKVNDTFLIFTMAYESGEPRPDRVEVSDAAFVPLAELADSADAAPFTRAIASRVPDASGFELDPYEPPDERLGHEAYLLFRAPAKVH
jgi:ADP-ribose pyrophosphatase YjhB (NUDIX family)